MPRRDGKRVLYALAGEDDVIALLKALGRVGERNAAEIERVMAAYFRARDAMEPITRKGLVKRLKDGLVTVLDVRPEA
ncbi:MAG: ArsR family transcriptional regulator, partial [Hyphomicrobiaceae bacterium]